MDNHLCDLETYILKQRGDKMKRLTEKQTEAIRTKKYYNGFTVLCPFCGKSLKETEYTFNKTEKNYVCTKCYNKLTKNGGNK